MSLSELDLITLVIEVKKSRVNIALQSSMSFQLFILFGHECCLELVKSDILKIVDRRELDKTVQKFNQTFFSFAFALIPDELQANQLVLDAISILSFSDRFDGAELSENISEIKMFVLSEIWKLGKKRIMQLGRANEILDDGRKDYRDFFQLKIEQRATLFLNSIEGFSFEEIASILKVTRSEVIVDINGARAGMIDTAGVNYDWGLS